MIGDADAEDVTFINGEAVAEFSLKGGQNAEFSDLPTGTTFTVEELPEERDGSSEMPPVEAHEHEGKPLPCPAEERETPRPRPAQLALLQDHGSAPGLQLTFSRNAVVQAVVMAEVLNRPRFEKGRRAIR